MTGVAPGGAAPPYFEDLSPGIGRRPARAAFTSSAGRLDLNGTWRFRLSPSVAEAPPDLMADAVDEREWCDLPVPSHWVLHGHGAPIYTNTAYPFPIDPPRVPDETPTGDHRRRFDLPPGWRREGTVLRFEGVDSCCRVWLNEVEVGTSKGSRLPVEFAAGHVLRERDNVLAVRVHQWSSGSYLEDQDMWWLPGIFRDVALLERPSGGLNDFFVHAGYDHLTGQGTLLVEADPGALLDVPELGLRAHPAGREILLESVEPWTAETPRLYRGVLRTPVEEVPVRIGFRSVRIEDGLLTVNGRPLLLRGVNRHEFDPDRGRAVTVDAMRADVLMMKRHNIDAVRTSHYPPHPAFLDLCDELGLWVVDECDLETHGFQSLEWRGNPVDDPAWAPMLLDRMQRTVERDKNHPSVIIWSLGNESGAGCNLDEMAAWTRRRDPGRPLHYERDETYRDSDLFCRMYEPLDEVERIGRGEEATPPALHGEPALEARRRAMPFVLTEYAHAMGNGPGGLADYQRAFETYSRCQGGFVWEWIDHGLRQRLPDGRERFAYGGDFGEVLHSGTFVIDGLVFPDRTPSPGLIEYKKVIEPVRIIGGGATPGTLHVENRYGFRDLSHLAFTWSLEVEGARVADGALEVPAVLAGGSADLRMPELPGVDGPGERWLTVRGVLAGDEPWAPAGHEVCWGQVALPEVPLVSSAATAARVLARHPPQVDGAGILLGRAAFDARRGTLCELDGLRIEDLRLDVWRAPTDNDLGLRVRGPDPAAVAAQWRAVGLDRVTHRIDGVEWGLDQLLVRARVAPAHTDVALRVVYRWVAEGDEVGLTVHVVPEGEWRCPLPRLGLRMVLPERIGAVSWFGGGPGEAYPDSRRAARVGRFSSTVDALQTPYVVPQENGHRIDVRWAELVDAGGEGLRVDGAPAFGLTVRRWPSEALDRAAHTTDLRPTDRVYLNLDHAQQGLGSASCGPGVLPRYRLTARESTFSFRFRRLPLR